MVVSLVINKLLSLICQLLKYLILHQKPQLLVPQHRLENHRLVLLNLELLLLLLTNLFLLLLDFHLCFLGTPIILMENLLQFDEDWILWLYQLVDCWASFLRLIDWRRLCCHDTD